MMIKLEDLLTEILLEVFSYIEPYQLLELQFLNKNLKKTVGIIINHHLSVTSYIDEKGWLKVQKKFINKCPMKLKELTVFNRDQFIFLKPHNNIRKLNIKSQAHLLNKTQDCFECLQELVLDITIETNDKFTRLEHILVNLEKFSYTSGLDINLDRILLLLNPNKLKVLRLKSDFGKIKLGNIDRFKDFKELEYLTLDSTPIEINFQITHHSNNNIFPSLKLLELNGSFVSGFDFKVFGTILSSTKIQTNLYLWHGYTSGVELIKESGVEKALIDYIYSDYNIKTVDGIANSIKPILNISSIKTVNFRAISQLSEVVEYIESFLVYSQVEKLTFTNNRISIQNLFGLLTYFPNVKEVKVISGTLNNYNNVALRLPNNLTQFFLILNRSCIHQDRNGILNVLEGINYYLY